MDCRSSRRGGRQDPRNPSFTISDPPPARTPRRLSAVLQIQINLNHDDSPRKLEVQTHLERGLEIVSYIKEVRQRGRK